MMRLNTLLFFGVMFVLFNGISPSYGTVSKVVDTLDGKDSKDSTLDSSSITITKEEADTVALTEVITTTESIGDVKSDTVAGDKKSDEIRLVKRKYDFKRKVFHAAGMMLFVALMMGTSQSWNPQ